MTIKTTYKGKFLGMNVAQSIENNTRRMLRKVGEQTVEKMREETRKHDWKGRLTDSISWRTTYEDGPMGGSAKQEDRLSPPNVPDSVDIGTANPYAFYREFGAGPHRSAVGSDEFIANMKDWFRDKIGGDPDGEDAQHFWNIIRKIREGQDGAPFVMPSIPYLMKIAARESRFAGFARNIK